MKRYTMWLDPIRQVAPLIRIAKREGVKVAQLVRRAIDEFISRNR